MADAHFLPLAESRSTCVQEIVKFHVDRRDGIHLQNNRFVSPLHDLHFTELYRDDAIGPMAESVFQHALWVTQADENERVKIEISGKPYRIGATLNLLFGKSMAAQPQCLLFPTYRPKNLNMKSRAEHNVRHTSKKLSCSSFVPFHQPLLPPALLCPHHPRSPGPFRREEPIGDLGLTEMLHVRT
jgi:hypothetical protein